MDANPTTTTESAKADPTVGHTSTPWEMHDGHVYGPGNCMIPKVDEPGEHRTGLIALVYGGTVYPNGRMSQIGEHEANAALIVRAVNAHAELVAALKRARDFCDLCDTRPLRTLEMIDAALALARGEA